MLPGVMSSPDPAPPMMPYITNKRITLLGAKVDAVYAKQEATVPMMMILLKPYLSIKMDEIEANSHSVVEWIDCIHDTVLVLQFKSLISEPMTTPKLLSMPITIALLMQALIHIIHAKTPSSLALSKADKLTILSRCPVFCLPVGISNLDIGAENMFPNAATSVLL